MGRKREMLLVIDTETCNTLEQPLPYDIGYAVCDRQGKVYLRRPFVVAETFLDMKDVMTSAYYAEKIPHYWEDIKNKKRTVKTFMNIRKIIRQDMKDFNIKKVGAYNMHFDRTALDTLTRYVTKSKIRWFFPYGTEYFCIWHMACQVLLNTRTYIKFAKQNGMVSEKGNILTSAEATHRFLTKNMDFVESHTGLEDVEIEIGILARCYKTHKKMNTSINRLCWRIPQKKK